MSITGEALGVTHRCAKAWKTTERRPRSPLSINVIPQFNCGITNLHHRLFHNFGKVLLLKDDLSVGIHRH